MLKIAIAIDLQNDFTIGSLGNEENLKVCLNASELLHNFKKHHLFATLDTHFKETYFNTIEGKNLPVLHTIKDTWGHKLHESIEPYFSLFNEKQLNITIEKNTYGAISMGEKIKNLLNLKNEDEFEIVIFGLLTDYCVISNFCILRSTFPNAKIYVISDCSMGLNQETHEKALFIMNGLNAITMTKEEYLLKEKTQGDN